MSTLSKLLKIAGMLGFIGLALPGLAQAGGGYSACFAHQSDKNRVLWTRPFMAEERDRETIAVNFLSYLKEKSYVQDMAAVSGTCVWHSYETSAASAVEDFKAQFRNATNLGVSFSGGIAKPDYEAIKMDADCAREDAKGCLGYGRLLSNGSRGVKRDDIKAAAYYLKSCLLGNANGCASLGWVNATGTGVPQNWESARSYYEIGCTGKNAMACYNLAAGYVEGSFGAVDYVKAIGYYQTACDLNHANACNNLGWHYASGNGVEVDNAKAMAFYTKGCSLGSARGCTNQKALESKM